MVSNQLVYTDPDSGSVYTLDYVDEGPESIKVRVGSPENAEGVLIPFAALMTLLTVYQLDVCSDYLERRPVRE